jgi:hypothetical protein
MWKSLVEYNRAEFLSGESIELRKYTLQFGNLEALKLLIFMDMRYFYNCKPDQLKCRLRLVYFITSLDIN